MERYRGAGEDEWIYLEVIPCRSGETARLALVEKLLENACPGLPPRMESHKIDLGFESGAAGNYQKAFAVGNLYVYLRMAGPEPDWLLQKIPD